MGRSRLNHLRTVAAAAVGLSCGEAVAAAAPQPDAAKIAAVASGEIHEARADWWGFEPANATTCLQSALDSGVARVVVPAMGTPWIVDPIQLRSDQEVVFEDGTVVEALKGSFKGRKESLFNAVNISNVVIRGAGSVVWRMHKKDYQNPDLYERAEWRHNLNLLSSASITVSNLTLRSSGGDGIYVGSSRVPFDYCRDIAIRDCRIEDQHRQGISVISVQGLLIENCVIRDTAGTAPQAGIDFEPNSHDQWLHKIVVRNCRFENNAGGAVILFHFPRGEGNPITFRFEDCTAVSNRFSGGFGARPPFDRIEVVATNCVETLQAGTNVINDFWRDWQNMRILDAAERAVVDRCRRITLDSVALSAPDAVTAGDQEKLPRQPLLRRRAHYLLMAEKAGQQLRFNVSLQGGSGKGMKVSVRTTQGDPVPMAFWAEEDQGIPELGPGPLTIHGKGRKEKFVFEAPAPGAYLVECDPGGGWFRFEPGGARAAFVALDGPVNFFSGAGTGTYYFHVPAGTREFYLDAAGMGGEKVKVSLFDAAGRIVHEQDPISLAVQFVVTRPEDSPSEIWSVRTESAQGFYLEDFSLDLFGVPPIFAVSPGSLPVLGAAK